MTTGSGAYRLNPENGRVTRPDGTIAQLSKRERDVLHVLHMMRGHWVSHAIISELVWGGHTCSAHVNVQVNHIRRKCGADVIDSSPRRGFGYSVGVV